MINIKKILSLSTISIILCNNLNALTFEINKEDEYLKTFKQAFLSPDDHRIIVNCKSCGIDKNSKSYYDILDNVDKNSNITFVLNGISATYNKEVFLNNMDHLFLVENKINNIKEDIKENDYIEIDGKKISINKIKELLNKDTKSKEKSLDKEEIKTMINNIPLKEIMIDNNDSLKEDKIIEKEIVKENKPILDKNYGEKTIIKEKEEIKNIINQNEYIIATYNKEEFAKNFVNSKLNGYDTKIIKTKNNKYVLKLYSDKDELNFIRQYSKDAYLVKKNNISNIKESVVNKDIEKNEEQIIDVIGVISSLKKEYVDLYFRENFKNENIGIKKTKNGYYLGYIILEKNENKMMKVKELKKISKDAWLINNFKI